MLILVSAYSWAVFYYTLLLLYLPTVVLSYTVHHNCCICLQLYFPLLYTIASLSAYSCIVLYCTLSLLYLSTAVLFSNVNYYYCICLQMYCPLLYTITVYLPKVLLAFTVHYCFSICLQLYCPLLYTISTVSAYSCTVLYCTLSLLYLHTAAVYSIFHYLYCICLQL